MAAKNEEEKARPSSTPIRSVLLYACYLAAIFYASDGFIPIPELQFAAFASFYLFVLAKLAFPPVTATRPPQAYTGFKLKILRYYVSVAAVIGLVLPLILLLVGLYRGDRHLFRSVVPHTALLVFQIMSERVAGSSDAVSFPIRAFVPISYNARRLFTIWSWMIVEFARPGGGGGWERFAKFVAVANMVFWSFNLFCFLLPLFLPLAMRSYYEHAIRKEKLETQRID
ncbi:hypothetical protein SELMODRAFT_270633 [Selaginella moellendorffii]|uniref:DUF7733 domain-containing protein n=1 Tax=Selaginella moellendorffii TaxID=88036 RepID=D8R8B7_SELML|nr:uncharacterized protein LOC9635748 [Selaginella moellendorffii]XP_024528122.1 uncharacterized protein LOC9635748 [Selaginella moellendorffii]EFJ32034.1 hypothetical protein SELMODRAFT_270633 [Selaginella moellendorffii]|eukprot:XP_002967435.1 uncharacterized protein LOC9635748 [Selaginella moellendorffii]